MPRVNCVSFMSQRAPFRLQVVEDFMADRNAPPRIHISTTTEFDAHGTCGLPPDEEMMRRECPMLRSAVKVARYLRKLGPKKIIAAPEEIARAVAPPEEVADPGTILWKPMAKSGSQLPPGLRRIYK